MTEIHVDKLPETPADFAVLYVRWYLAEHRMPVSEPDAVWFLAHKRGLGGDVAGGGCL